MRNGPAVTTHPASPGRGHRTDLTKGGDMSGIPNPAENQAMTYERALAESRELGAVKCGDAAAIAGWCARLKFVMVCPGSPKLIWEGAQRAGLSPRQLMKMTYDDPVAVRLLARGVSSS